MDEQLTFEFEPRPTIKGFPELRWTGKRPYRSTQLRYPGFTPEQLKKSFHADIYCFDSIPEKECFMQYITSGKVAEVYFTGMFTGGQGDLSVHYYDPESGRIRQYYPDFLAKMMDGSYQLIEVKGDNKIDDTVVKAKQVAAEEMAIVSGMRYLMYAGSSIMSSHILD